MVKEKLKILMISSKPFRPEPWIYREAKSLINNGYDVTVIGWDRERKYEEKEEIDGIKVERIRLKASYGSFTQLLPLFPIFYLMLLSRLLNIDFDIIDCHNFDTLPVGMFAGKLKGKKVIYHSLDLYFTWFYRETTSKFKEILSNLFRKLEILFLSKIDHLIVPTPGSLEYYKKYCTRCGITVLMNTPDKSFFLKCNSNKIKKNTGNKFVVSYIGGIRYEKPIINLIEATRELGDVEVLIVGGGIKAKNIKQKSQGYANVSIVGEVPYREVIGYYNQSDCVYAVYDSKVENIKFAIPVKVFEAMACGLPVIVNKNIWVSEFVEKNRIGLCVDESNIEGIRNAILELKNNRNLRNDFGKNGRMLFEEKYNWEKQEECLLRIYGSFEKMKISKIHK